MSESIQPSPKLTSVENFFLSGSAAVVSKTIAAPFERIKMLLQSQDENIRKGRLKEPYKGVVDCAVKVYSHEGPLAFWRSNGTNCLRYFPTQALNFTFRDKIKERFPIRTTDSQLTKLGRNVASGGLAGGMSSVFVYHLDYARTRLANDVIGADGQRRFKNLFEVYRVTWAADGFVGLHRGFMLSLVAIVTYRGAYFGLYDTLKPIVLPKNPGLLESFALGYGVTVTAGMAAYPMDTVRRRMMEVSGEDKALQYRGSVDATRQIYYNEGPRSFFKGAGANILRSVAGAGVLAGFDKLQSLYLNWKEHGTFFPTVPAGEKNI